MSGGKKCTNIEESASKAAHDYHDYDIVSQLNKFHNSKDCQTRPIILEKRPSFERPEIHGQGAVGAYMALGENGTQVQYR